MSEQLKVVEVHLGEEGTVCMLHGFGASAQDLVPLASEVGLGHRWLFPGAPVQISVAGMYQGQAWFPREPEELEKALYGGYFLSLQTLQPPGLAGAAEQVRQMLDHRGVQWSQLVIGGFSQGAMVCAEILRQALRDGLPMPAAAVILSGALVARSWWDGVPPVGQQGRGRVLPRVYQAHGRSDRILPLEEGRALTGILEDAGFSVTLQEFSGDHSIPAEVVAGLRRFLQENLI